MATVYQNSCSDLPVQTTHLINFLKSKLSLGAVTVVYLEPSSHLEFEGQLIGFKEKTWGDQWIIQAQSDSIPDDWEDQDRQDYIHNPCSVDMYDPRQLVAILHDETGNLLLKQAIIAHCEMFKVER